MSSKWALLREPVRRPQGSIVVDWAPSFPRKAPAAGRGLEHVVRQEPDAATIAVQTLDKLSERALLDELLLQSLQTHETGTGGGL